MLVVTYRADILSAAGHLSRKGRSVRIVRDWDPSFIGRAYVQRRNHVAADQVWIQTLARPFRDETSAQEDYPAGPYVAFPADHRAGAAEAQAQEGDPR